MLLRECNDCGLVFNAILDSKAIPYDERYENRQNFSAGFLAMLEQTASTLANRYSLKGGAVLEVGCGKGDFLHLLCERAQCRGLGFDTSCEVVGAQTDRRVTFFQRYVTPEDVTEKINLIVCRHVVEHVPQIGDFFQLLHRLAVAGGGSAVYVETPALEWIVEHHAFWDVFYEHCNYFQTGTLRRLAEKAGFTVLDHRRIFGGQYQALELRTASSDTARPDEPPQTTPLLCTFARDLANSVNEVISKLMEAGASNGWAIWGAGAKGVSIAGALSHMPPLFVVDSNPAKQGTFIPGTNVPVVAPSDTRLGVIPVVLIVNSYYACEIRECLAHFDFHPNLVSL